MIFLLLKTKKQHARCRKTTVPDLSYRVWIQLMVKQSRYLSIGTSTSCTISIMNENSQRTMKPDNFRSRRPQSPEPQEIIESNWHHITPWTCSWGRIRSEGSTHGFEEPSLNQQRAVVPYIKGYDVIAQSPSVTAWWEQHTSSTSCRD